MSLMDRLLKASTSKLSSALNDSVVLTKKDMIPTSVPMVNAALSGRVDGGLTPGLTMIAGESKRFKTAFALLMIASYQKKYPDAVCLFYDSEFGSPQAYFDSFGIDASKVVHTPISDVEMLKHDIMVQLNEIKRGDHVIVVIDSIGNLASKKEIDDALDGKSVADMTRAKAMKSLFRMVTPHLTLKDIPMIVVNHTYKEIGMFPKDIVGGGTGSMYSSDTVWIIGRRQEKDGKDVTGYHFIINVEKSRFVKEKSIIPISVSFEKGIHKWSGLFDLALEGQYLAAPKQGWYQLVNRETGELTGKNFRRDDLDDDGDFWKNMFKTTDLAEFIRKKYQLSDSQLVTDHSTIEE